MFFIVSKVFWLVVQPISIILLLTLVALILILIHRRRTALVVLVVALSIGSLLSYTSLGYLLIQPLENRFSVPAPPPEAVETIVMLGGATDSHVSAVRQTVALNNAGERLTTTLWLARRYPDARIVLSGGGGALSIEGESEAETAKRFLAEHGIAEDRLILEGQSRNTIENAAYTRELVGAGAEPVVLVTSAFHMPRSVGLFRHEGVEVLAWPTDFRSLGNQDVGLSLADPMENLLTASTAMREWTGLLVYRLTGQIDELFPAP